MKKVIALMVCILMVAAFVISSGYSATKEGTATGKKIKTTKKSKTSKTKSIPKFTNDKNEVLKNKKLQMIQKNTAIIKSPSCECAPKPDPADVHPSTQF